MEQRRAKTGSGQDMPFLPAAVGEVESWAAHFFVGGEAELPLAEELFGAT